MFVNKLLNEKVKRKILFFLFKFKFFAIHLSFEFENQYETNSKHKKISQSICRNQVLRPKQIQQKRNRLSEIKPKFDLLVTSKSGIRFWVQSFVKNLMLNLVAHIVSFKLGWFLASRDYRLDLHLLNAFADVTLLLW